MAHYKNTLHQCLTCLMFVLCSFSTSTGQTLPYVAIKDGKSTIMLNDKPFLILGGEVHNSSSSNLEYMGRLWDDLKALRLNTVLAPVSWEQFEPVEGKYEYTLLDGLIDQARQNDTKLIILWFGSWKNLVSTYVPSWVKKDRKRFPLFESQNGKAYQMLSAFSEESLHADCKAFAALMRHIREKDSREQTVIMVQVENEVGSDGSRDHCQQARKAYQGQVPSTLIQYIKDNEGKLAQELRERWENMGCKTRGTWKEIFGDDRYSDDLFSAWHLASYIGKVVKAGKDEYALPMFVNAALGRQNLKINSYPSGGPVPSLMDVWKAAAPHLDMLCPDIYHDDFDHICSRFSTSSNPLFIPEIKFSQNPGLRAMKAVSNHGSMGFSPFAIEDYNNGTQISMDFAKTYAFLSQLSPLLAAKRPMLEMVTVETDSLAENEITLGKYKITCKPHLTNGYAMIVQDTEDSFYVIGSHVMIDFCLNEGLKGKITGILKAEEGYLEQGKWIPTRQMNGDETMIDYSFNRLFDKGKNGNGLRFAELAMQKVYLYQY